ncbi:hypothetical protein QQP08_020064 [Theobroma cacao]|nr:hypothetical protein QQP08_020064 [Theobroma cacao]
MEADVGAVQSESREEDKQIGSTKPDDMPISLDQSWVKTFWGMRRSPIIQLFNPTLKVELCEKSARDNSFNLKHLFHCVGHPVLLPLQICIQLNNSYDNIKETQLFQTLRWNLIKFFKRDFRLQSYMQVKRRWTK